MQKYIFSLTCPDSGKIKYIGHTYNPIRRYYYYSNVDEKNSVGDWIKSFPKNNRPKLTVIESVSAKNAKKRVEYWKKYYNKNNLLDLIKDKKSELIRFFVSKKDFELLMKDKEKYEIDKFADYCRFKLIKELDV